jgi:large subunit ribosomal protein L17
MRHRNSVKQLGRTHAHRRAMFGNMVTSFFRHERIETTKQKGKELKRISEKLITRAKRNIDLSSKDEGKKLHNKRVVMRIIKDRDVVKKLFDDIAFRFKERNGGYTRLYLLGKRPGDAAEMSIVELVVKKVEKKKPEESEKQVKKERKSKKESAVEAKIEPKKEAVKEKKEPKKEAVKEKKKSPKGKKESKKGAKGKEKADSQKTKAKKKEK